MAIKTPNNIMTGAEQVFWDLSDLFQSVADLEASLQAAGSEAAAFAAAYRTRVAALSPSQLAGALKEFEALHDRVGRAHTYAYLAWCTATEDAERGALLQKVTEQSTQIDQQILFFELELIQLERLHGDLPSEPPLAGYRHYLETLRLRRPHILSEPEERILSEKSITGSSAWERFFEETLGAARFPFQGREATEQEVLSKLYDPDRELRSQAALAFTEGLQRTLRQLTYVFNTVLAEKASDDRLRRFPHWLASRNLSNEIDDEAVGALIDSVSNRCDLVRRFYLLKKQQLGLEILYDYDRYAPVGNLEHHYGWNQARELVLEAYADFHPAMAEIAGFFFRLNWIDAPVRPGKRGGAFSHRAVPDVHPYIMLNFTGTIRDVQTLAHELGHGVHQYLARRQGSLQGRTPLTTSETASVFGEMLVFDRLLKMEHRPEVRLALLMSKIDDTMATVFRQVALHRFEERIHALRRSEGELSSLRFSEVWMETQREIFQGSVTLGTHYGIWWSYIPHFIHSPGYVYAYAFGELLVLALYARYRAQGEPFIQKYLDLLSAGGSEWPHVLIERLGVDLQDRSFWDQGLEAIDVLIGEAEQLAGQIPAPSPTRSESC